MPPPRQLASSDSRRSSAHLLGSEQRGGGRLLLPPARIPERLAALLQLGVGRVQADNGGLQLLLGACRQGDSLPCSAQPGGRPNQGVDRWPGSPEGGTPGDMWQPVAWVADSSQARLAGRLPAA
jgi:hypothetical protein